MIPLVLSTLMIHESRGLKRNPGEVGDRWICLEQLPDDDPSQMRYQVCIHHPEYVVTPTGRSRQEPEIVSRTNDETIAKRTYAVYLRLLGGTPPAEYDPPAADPSARVLDLERDLARALDRLDGVLARLDDLESEAGKKKK